MKEEHAADRAAGEVIYSSDGVPPVSIVPKVKGVKNSGDGGMDILDAGDNAPVERAFEVFSGKVYPVITTSSSSNAKLFVLPKTETPSQRLARLQQEVLELEQDLSASSDFNAKEAGPAFMEVISDLKNRLETQSGAAATAKNQEEMTRSIQQHLEQWQSANKSDPGRGVAGTEAGVVYELYGGVGSAPSAGSSDLSLEERLRLVESLVGAGATAPKNRTLLTRLEEMEQFMKNLDPKALEQASAKAKVIRSDLEAASKARNKLASAASFRKEDAKTISALYDQMTHLEGLSGHLPALVDRLQQLASLHAQSSSFSVRLTQSEKEVVQLQALVKNLEDTMTKAEAGMMENAKVIEKNMQQLDEQMKNL